MEKMLEQMINTASTITEEQWKAITIITAILLVFDGILYFNNMCLQKAFEIRERRTEYKMKKLLSELQDQYPFPEYLYCDKLCDIKCDYCKYSRICYLEYLSDKTDNKDLKRYIKYQIKDIKKRLSQWD